MKVDLLNLLSRIRTLFTPKITIDVRKAQLQPVRNFVALNAANSHKELSANPRSLEMLSHQFQIEFFEDFKDLNC